jgi:hypothetical protein
MLKGGSKVSLRRQLVTELSEYAAKCRGQRPEDIPELDEMPQADLSDILRNYQQTSYDQY